MHAFQNRLLLAFVFAIGIGHAVAHAATLCVSDAPSLNSALATYILQPDGSTLTIKLVQGTYAVGNAFGSLNLVTYPNEIGLQLLGGYTTGCATRVVNPANTVLDGQNQPNGALRIIAEGDADVRIEGLTFTRFVDNSDLGATLAVHMDVGTGDAGTFRVQHNRFVSNVARTTVDLQGALLVVVNNLLAGNTVSGSSASALYITYGYDADTMAMVTNNTIVNTSGGAGILVRTPEPYSSDRPANVTNNILWGNATDLNLTAFDFSANAPVAVESNVIGTVAGYVLPASNLRSDPRFVNAAGQNFRLANNSPAINSGAAFQFFGFPAHDLDGHSRIIGSLIDRGAYESNLDDTTTAVVTTTADNGNNAAPIAGSLRAAIKAGNAASGPFRIIFNIPGGCPALLHLAAPMLDIKGDVTVDGTTQPGWTPNTGYGVFDSNICLYINGAGNTNTPWALHVPASAANSARLVVRGLGLAGFNDAAIKLEGGRNHRIYGNLFGPVAFTPASYSAIRVTGNSGGAFIGGYDNPEASNLVAVASGPGIYLDNVAGGSTIANNLIGFQADGSGNGGNQSGIYVYNSPGNRIEYNQIGNNTGWGIILSGPTTSGNTIQYNMLGANQGGAVIAPNGDGAVLMNFGAHDNTIGAPLTATWGGNMILYNDGPGVWISASGGTGNRVLSNRISYNSGLAIDLAQAGPSANQSGNPASGPNNLQNHPLLTSAMRAAAGATTRVSGSLSSAPGTPYRIDVYWGGSSCRADGRGTAITALAPFQVTTGATGSVTFSLDLGIDASVPLGTLSATATDPAGNTSEIGNCVVEIADDRIFGNGFD